VQRRWTTPLTLATGEAATRLKADCFQWLSLLTHATLAAHSCHSRCSLMPLTHAADSHRWLMPTTDANNWCQQLMPPTDANNSCHSFLPLTHATDSCKWLMLFTLATVQAFPLEMPLKNHRSLLQNTVSFTGLFCKRDLSFCGSSRPCVPHGQEESGKRANEIRDNKNRRYENPSEWESWEST